MNERGLFLVLDGVDGAGKTTQLRLLAEWLESQGRTVVRVRDPGGTWLGDRLRTILLDPTSSISMGAETLLYLASRSQLVEEHIRPALVRGDVVVSDRYELSTIVYQGTAGRVASDAIRNACALARGECVPDWTGVLDLDPEDAMARENRERDRIERRGQEYFHRVRDGFRAEAAADPLRVTLIDAGRSVADVHRSIREEVERVVVRHRA